jgi:methylmalonyl-CoA/ethylmalonyl-CoA epimerase
MMLKIEHLGIAVKSLEDRIPLFEKILGTPCYKIERVESEGVNTAFFQVGESKIELLDSELEDSAIGKFLAKRGEGMHHIAFQVEDIGKAMQLIDLLGIRLLNKEPKSGADNKLICFLHPADTSGVLIELCQEKPAG